MSLSTLRYTLVADGPSDAALSPIIEWVLQRAVPPELSIRGAVADFRLEREPPRSLAARLQVACRQFPCDLLIIHRDAERQSIESRHAEIEQAVDSSEDPFPIHVPMVPVRMTEAWLLIDPVAICRAADNPSFSGRLQLPPVDRLEALPDPKGVLEDRLRLAADLRGKRRRHQFNRRLQQIRRRVAHRIEDFGALEQLPAFRTFETTLTGAARRLAFGSAPT